MTTISQTSRLLPTLGKLYRQHAVLGARRWQSTVADPADPFQSHLQSKTEAELMALMNRDQDDVDAKELAEDSSEEVCSTIHAFNTPPPRPHTHNHECMLDTKQLSTLTSPSIRND